ncbi:acyl--CoA ligase [Simkania negevensis]|uniref:Acyl--CoA ligase n=1 Tax=Simkania negevensis TaxID=83561 RepID=A0ABS3ART7_9BACT|nr:acyl--CoA ligase [Simkania negevensis]
MYLLDFLHQQNRHYPDKLFLCSDNNRYTYSEAFIAVQKTAAFFKNNDISAGNRVILYFDDKIRLLFSYFACQAIGAIPAPIDNFSKHLSIHYTASHIQATALITDKKLPSADKLPCPVLTFPDLNTITTLAWDQTRSDIAHLLFTSGTTGKPKAVMISQNALLFTTLSIIRWAQMRHGDHELITLHLSHSFGLGHIHCHLILGNTISLLPSARDLSMLLKSLADKQITGYAATPAQLTLLTQSYQNELRQYAQQLRYLIVNTAKVEEETISSLMQLLPKTNFYMYYGLTEASRSTYIHYNEKSKKLHTVGKCAPGISVKIDHIEGQEGEICIKGANLMMGYWGEETSNAFDSTGWFHTGDVGDIDDDGFLSVKGRLHDRINVDGLKCHPQEIEEVLARCKGVVECAVFGVEHPLTTHEVVAAIVCSGDEEKKTFQNTLRSHCKKSLEPYKIPKRFLFVHSLPKTESGKIQRTLLAQKTINKTAVY